jgi:hypothetical protein
MKLPCQPLGRRLHRQRQAAIGHGIRFARLLHDGHRTRCTRLLLKRPQHDAMAAIAPRV